MEKQSKQELSLDNRWGGTALKEASERMKAHATGCMRVTANVVSSISKAWK